MTTLPMSSAKNPEASTTETGPSSWRMLLLLGASVGTAACTTPCEGRYDFYDAWRKRKVIEVGTAQGIGRSSPRNCRKDATPRAADARYADVQYHGVSRPTSRIVPFGPDSTLKAGDFVYVYVKVDDCNSAVPTRAVQVDTW